MTSYAPSRALWDQSSSLFVKGFSRNGSPPWREDDKDGHYMFEIGDNLTYRCNYLHYHETYYSCHCLCCLCGASINNGVATYEFGFFLLIWTCIKLTMVD